jgi:4-hydroxy-tetrahydrodipicolinate synthase
MNADRSSLGGVLSVLCTPFHASGALDMKALDALVDHQLSWNVDALVVFGLAGELYKLTDEERRRVLSAVVNRVDGAVPIIAGTEHTGTEGAVARSREAIELGAQAVMVYPPTFVRPDRAGVLDYFLSVANSITAPVIIQDAPAWTGVALPVDLLVEIAQTASNAAWVKVEAPPAAPKIRALRERGLTAVAGYGALHVLEDLAAGVAALMPGCALPGLYLEMWAAHQSGDADRLWSTFQTALPLLSFQMSSLDTFVAIQKLLLREAGVLQSADLRRPVSPFTAEQRKWLEYLLQRTDLRRYLGWPA